MNPRLHQSRFVRRDLGNQGIPWKCSFAASVVGLTVLWRYGKQQNTDMGSDLKAVKAIVKALKSMKLLKADLKEMSLNSNEPKCDELFHMGIIAHWVSVRVGNVVSNFCEDGLKETFLAIFKDSSEGKSPFPIDRGIGRL